MAKTFDPKAKAKRQKIIAAVGGVILVALLVWRVPQVIALMNKKPAATPSTVPAPASPTPGVPLPPPSPGSPAPAAEGILVDSDPAPAPAPGQLISFDRFVSKDPFAQQGAASCVPDASGDESVPCSAAAPSGKAQPREPVGVPEPVFDVPDSKPAPKAAQTSTRIAINGETETVNVGSAFPSADPVFRLVSAAKGSAKIAIDGGTYASGAATITLKKGEPVTLVNTADGTRYRLVLIAV